LKYEKKPIEIIERFSQTEENFNTYKAIIDIFMSTLNRKPSSQELFNSFAAVSNNEISMSQLQEMCTKQNESGNPGSEVQDIVNRNWSIKSVISIDSGIVAIKDIPASELNDDNITQLIDEEYKKVYHVNADDITKNYFITKYIELGQNTDKLRDAIKSTSTSQKYSDITDSTVVSLPLKNSVAVGMSEAPYVGSDTPPDKSPTYYLNRPNVYNILTNKRRSPDDTCSSTGIRETNDSISGEMSYLDSKPLFDKDFGKLRKDIQFSVPQYRPPVCRTTTPSTVNPLMTQSALIGTLLDDSKDTQVGSLLPKFIYSNLN
jgi:hypothetical protein